MVSILVTAGPTREHIDDIRFLANGSTGTMGHALAAAGLAAGHRVAVVLGPGCVAMPPGVEVDQVTSALEMQAAADRRFSGCDVLIAAAAVSDYRPARRLSGKPPKAGAWQLELVPNPDIVAGLAARKGPRVVVGFALEAAGTDPAAAEQRARDKLARKQLDLVVHNSSEAIGAAAAAAVLLWADGRRQEVPATDKAALAARIVDAAVQLWQAGQRR